MLTSVCEDRSEFFLPPYLFFHDTKLRTLVLNVKIPLYLAHVLISYYLCSVIKNNLLMKTIYGFDIDVKGIVTLTHKTTGKQKHFIVYHSKMWNCLTTCTTSDVSGMTQKKAATLPQIPKENITIDHITNEHWF